MAGVSAPRFVEAKISQRPVVLFSKTYCPESKKVKRLLKEEYSLNHKSFEVVNIERRQDVNQIEDYFMIMCLSERREIPQLYVDGNYVGNEERIMRSHDNGSLAVILAAAGVIDSLVVQGKATTSPMKACAASRTVTPACALNEKNESEKNESNKTTNPSKPDQSNETTEPSKPAESSNTMELSNSAESNETGDPSKPADSSETAEPSKPAESSETTDPAAQTKNHQ